VIHGVHHNRIMIATRRSLCTKKNHYSKPHCHQHHEGHLLPFVANNLEEQTTKTKLTPDPYYFGGKWEKLKRKIIKKKQVSQGKK